MIIPAYIERVLKSGQAILLTGAGFSHMHMDLNGDNLPLGRALGESLWPIGFGAEPYDESASLDLIYQECLRSSLNKTRELLNLTFTTDPEYAPSRFSDWLRLPWHRVYTLNIDDSLKCVNPEVRSRYHEVSSGASTPGQIPAGKTAYVHLNGSLADFPKITFSPEDYADRTAHHDAWYHEFVGDIMTRAVVVVGSEVNEPPIWHYMALRSAEKGLREVRPKSFLVAPKLGIARRRQLENLNFDWVDKDEATFYVDHVSPIISDIPPSGYVSALNEPDYDVSRAIGQAPRGAASFLLGEQPKWGDISRGYAARFDSDEFLRSLVSGGGTVLVTGSAGSGKTTTLMKGAAHFVATGDRVAWVPASDFRPLPDLISSLHGYERVFIDDIDRFSESASYFLEHVGRIETVKSLVFSGRAIRLRQIGLLQRTEPSRSLVLEHLSAPDLERLLDELTAAKRLGALRGKPRAEQLRAISPGGDRQLLVALIEATSGESFLASVASECDSLDPIEERIYGVLCTAMWADGRALSRSDIIICLNEAGLREKSLPALQRLEESRLILKGGDRYTPRHRVIAEKAVDFYKSKGVIQTWIVELLFLCSTHYDPSNPRASAYGRTLVRLLNHTNLQELIGDGDVVRRVYEGAEGFLADDPHYWLQRGSFEVDRGDLNLAGNALSQARGMGDGGHLFETAWGMYLLAHAISNPASALSANRAHEALDLLENVAASRGKAAPHAFVIYLRYGCRWLQCAPLGILERQGLRDRIRQMISDARLHAFSYHEVKKEVNEAEAVLNKTKTVLD